jgi:acetolactate synthase small subunit
MAHLRNITIDQGTTFSTGFVVTDANGDVVDLTNQHFQAQLRKSYESSTYASFTVNVVDAINGEITLELSEQQSINLRYGRYVYDVMMKNNSGVMTRVVEGIATLTPKVTTWATTTTTQLG